MPNARSVEVIRKKLEELQKLPWPTNDEGMECRSWAIFDLECELARAEGRPEPTWTHKGVL